MTAIHSQAVPRLAPGMKLRFDATRDAWVILGPERLFLPDTHAVAVLRLIDGARSIAAIATTLADTFTASAATIEADILPMLQDLADRGVVRT